MKKIKQFWVYEYKPNGRKHKIDKALLSDYLEQKGYRKFNSFGDNKVVRLKDNIAYLKSSMDVYIDVLKYIKKQNNNELRSCFIEQGELLLISKKAILGGLPNLELKKYLDSKNEVCLFYKNGIVKIGKEGTSINSYSELKKSDNFIFDSSIIQRDYDSSVKGESEFKEFLEFVTNTKEDFNSFLSTIGYLISTYKNPSLTKAVIISDFFSQMRNNAFGRSGKGIIIQAISKIIDVVEYNGKVTDLTNDKFVFQNVTSSTRLVVLQDVTKEFKFDSLFSTLTDSMSIERKYTAKISLPFSESPKIVITSNFTIKENSDSFRDRKHLIMLNNFFNAENKPEKHLKNLLFDWGEKEYKRFDKFMSYCVEIFLDKGLVKFTDESLKAAKLVAETSKEFVEFMDDSIKSSKNKFKSKTILDKIPLKGDSISEKGKIISHWIVLYAQVKGFKLKKSKSGGVTVFNLMKK